MEKAESLSFPTVPGSGGRRQSLHNEILVGAKRFYCHLLTFLLSFVTGFTSLITTPLYHTLHKLYANPTSHHKKNTPEPWLMPDAIEIAPTKSMHALPPTQSIALVCTCGWCRG
jgi:hypothetical protein